MKIEEIVDDGKPANENGMSKRAKKKKTDGNENSNSQIVPKAVTSVPVLESEDEDGFPVEKTKHESTGKKSQNKSEKSDSASAKNLKRKSGAVDQDEQPAR